MIYTCVISAIFGRLHLLADTDDIESFSLDAQNRSCGRANGYVLPMSPALLPCVLDAPWRKMLKVETLM